MPGENGVGLLERFFGLLRAECLDRIIIFGAESLRRAVKSYLRTTIRRGVAKGSVIVSLRPATPAGLCRPSLLTTLGCQVRHSRTPSRLP